MKRQYAQLTRRDLLKLFGVTASATVTGRLLTSLDAPLVSAAATKDTLVVAQSIDISTFDVQRLIGIDAIVALANIYDRLVYLDYNNTIKPWLAIAWEVSADQLTWTFHLHKDAKFHDGSPVTSEAVKFTIDRAIGPGSGASLSKTYLVAISNVDTPDPYTVKLTTKAPLGPMLHNVGHQTALAILNPKVVQAHNGDLSKPVDAGSGMYKLVEWKPGEHLLLERNDAWWGPKPYFRQVMYRPIPDPATRTVMLEKGEADVATVLPLADVPRLMKNPALKIITNHGIRFMGYLMNVTRPPLNEVRVRRALNYAIDVDAIIKSLLNGYGRRARSIVSPTTEFYEPAYKFNYDPARAKQLLTEAGIKPGTKIEIAGPQGRFASDVEVSQAVAGYLRSAGFDPKVSVYGDYGRFLTTIGPGRMWDLYLDGWAPGSLDIDSNATSLVWSQGHNAWTGYANPKADELITLGRNSVDPKVRAKYYKELQDLLAEDVPFLLMYVGDSFSGTRRDICGFEVRGDDANLIKDAKVCG